MLAFIVTPKYFCLFVCFRCCSLLTLQCTIFSCMGIFGLIQLSLLATLLKTAIPPVDQDHNNPDNHRAVRGVPRVPESEVTVSSGPRTLRKPRNEVMFTSRYSKPPMTKNSKTLKPKNEVALTSLHNKTPKTKNSKPPKRDSIAKKPQGQKVIRIVKWTPPVRNWYRVGDLDFRKCSTAIPCEYVDKSSYNSSDIVMINAFYIKHETDMPSYRLPHQKWLFYNTEAPRIYHRFQQLGRHLNSFNLTLTYTHDADIVKPYGICLPRRNTIKKDPKSVTDYIRKIYGTLTDEAPWLSGEIKYAAYNRAKGKSRLAVWNTSDCTNANKRSEYVTLLQRYVTVDIYGECGNFTCKSNVGKECDAQLSNTYKFYLAFESSLCSEYITEKVWTRLEGDIVPIVLGGAKYEKYLPKHSYINVKDFSSPEKLATYLKRLDKNDTLYNEYFNWKKAYTCHNYVPGSPMACSICRHANERVNKRETAPNIDKFWSHDMCVSPKEFYRGVADILV